MLYEVITLRDRRLRRRFRAPRRDGRRSVARLAAGARRVATHRGRARPVTRRRQRMILLGVGLAAVGLAAGLVLAALGDTLTSYNFV